MTKEKILTIIIPSYNENKTIRKVVKTALNSRGVDNVIVVDDGSTDQTNKVINDLPIKILRHPKNKGYTAAIKTGLDNCETEYVAIIDADWRNITVEAIEKIITPILTKKADLVKANFDMARGRVTRYAARPMINILFPSANFEQPISGQFAGKRDFFKSVQIENSWGIAIGILIEAVNSGQRVIEVNIGKLVHKKRTEDEKELMAREVLETLIMKAGLIRNKYKAIIFNLDESLLSSSAFKKGFKELGIPEEEINNLSSLKDKGYLKQIEEIASQLEGVDIKKIEKVFSSINIPVKSQIVISRLKDRRFKVILLTTHFYQIAKIIADKLGIKNIESINLEVKNNRLTGKISTRSLNNYNQENQTTNLANAIKRITKRYNIKNKEIAYVTSSIKSIAVIDLVGLLIAYRPKNPELKLKSHKTISSLAELLLILE